MCIAGGLTHCLQGQAHLPPQVLKPQIGAQEVVFLGRLELHDHGVSFSGDQPARPLQHVGYILEVCVLKGHLPRTHTGVLPLVQ